MHSYMHSKRPIHLACSLPEHECHQGSAPFLALLQQFPYETFALLELAGPIGGWVKAISKES